jgi:hypothetical protein
MLVELLRQLQAVDFHSFAGFTAPAKLKRMKILGRRASHGVVALAILAGFAMGGDFKSAIITSSPLVVNVPTGSLGHTDADSNCHSNADALTQSGIARVERTAN